MKIAVLGEGPVCSTLLQHHGNSLLLDCCAEPVLERVPQQQQPHQQPSAKNSSSSSSSSSPLALCLRVPDLQRVVQSQDLHVALFSNPHGLLAVPYLHQLLQQQGRRLPLHMYCTEPCYHGFQHLALELLQVSTALQQQQHTEQQQQELQQQEAYKQQEQQQQLLPQQLQLYQQQMQLHCQQLSAQHCQPQPYIASRNPPFPQQQWPDAATGGVWCPPQQQHQHQQQQQQQQQPSAGPGGLNPPPAPPQQQPSAGPGGLIPPPAPPLLPPPKPPSLPQPQPAATPPAAPSPAVRAADVVPLFSQQQLQAVLAALQVVRFGQRLQLPGPWSLTAEARPAGSSIGAALWTLTVGSQRVTYLSPASMWPNHSAPLHTAALQNLDALVLGPGCLCPDLPLKPAEQLLPAAAGAAARAVLAGGRVLVPVLPSGTAVLQLLEHIPRALLATGGPAAAASTPLFYLSPSAPDALATSSSCCEYLEDPRKQAVLFNGQAPFEHDRQLETRQLRLFTGLAAEDKAAAAADGLVAAEPLANASAAAGESIFGVTVTTDYAEALQQVLAAGPCVVFVPLWSLAAGPAQQLVLHWCSEPRNLLLLPEQGPLATSWVQQCLQQQLLPPPQQQHWQVQYLPVCSTAGAVPAASAAPAASVPGACLNARQLLTLLLQQPLPKTQQSEAVGSECRVLLAAADRLLLESTLQADRVCLTGYSLTTLLSNVHGPPPAHPESSSSSSSAFSFQLVQLPNPLLEVRLSRELAKSLHLTPLMTPAAAAAAADALSSSAAAAAAAGGSKNAYRATEGDDAGSKQQVSVARVRALLSHQAGVWRLEPLPGGTKPDAVAAALQLQLDGGTPLLWGSVELTPLLAALQAAGFNSLYLDTAACTTEAGAAADARVIKLSTAEGDAEIWLTSCGTEIVCDSWIIRRQLLDLVMQQLHTVS